jgi:uncharacterized protein YlzI (FlbEa/FlbD family)
MKTIKITTIQGDDCIIFVDKITSIKDNGVDRTITLNSEKLIVSITIEDIMTLING